MVGREPSTDRIETLHPIPLVTVIIIKFLLSPGQAFSHLGLGTINHEPRTERKDQEPNRQELKPKESVPSYSSVSSIKEPNLFFVFLVPWLS